MKWALRGWRPSRIGPRLLAFNLLVVFVPVVGVLYLDVYEARLLQGQEREMVQQARVLAAVLGDGPRIDASLVERTFARLERRTEARIRVFDASGALVADSRRAPAPAAGLGSAEYPDEARTVPSSTRERVLYRLGALVANMRDRLVSVGRGWLTRLEVSPPGPPGQPDAEVQQALKGRYGAATRRTPGQRSLTLVSALPVRYDGDIIGAVVVSQSTFRILQALYHVRLRIFEIVILSIIAAALLTAIAAMTIVRPLKRLRGQASALAERREPLRAAFPGIERRDEIGALARALEELTRRLDSHIKRLESFTADVAHEFRNPLAAIRTAAETIAESDSADERQRFLQLMRRDVDRLDRLVAGVREMARLDGQLEHDALETLELGELLSSVIESARLASRHGASVVVHHEGACRVLATRARLAQAFENVLSNALSFAPPGTAVDVAMTSRSAVCRVSIADRGPGIPDAHLSRIFERFFSYRPGEERREHLGLGLAIAMQVVDSYGGSITARNREGGGAEIEIELPATAATNRLSSTSRS